MRATAGAGPTARAAWKAVALASVLVLTATGCSKGRAASSSATPSLIQVYVQQFRYHGMPASISAGYHQVVFKNNESFPITHEMIPVALPAGKTAADIAADAKAKGPDSEDDWLHIAGDFGTVDTGASIVEDWYLPPGNYAIACWQTGKANGGQNGPTHVSIGMYASFTVT